MSKKKIYVLLFLFSALAVFYRCQSSNKPKAQESAPATGGSFTAHGSLSEISLGNTPAPDFPDHEGKTEFMAYCGICHSLRYISMQPTFPAKTWKAEVDKMISKYHAPIDSNTSKKITQYLVEIKGKK